MSEQILSYRTLERLSTMIDNSSRFIMALSYAPISSVYYAEEHGPFLRIPTTLVCYSFEHFLKYYFTKPKQSREGCWDMLKSTITVPKAVSENINSIFTNLPFINRNLKTMLLPQVLFKIQKLALAYPRMEFLFGNCERS